MMMPTHSGVDGGVGSGARQPPAEIMGVGDEEGRGWQDESDSDDTVQLLTQHARPRSQSSGLGGKHLLAIIVAVTVVVLVAGTALLFMNKDELLALLSSLEAQPTGARIALFVVAYVVVALPLVLGCVVLNMIAAYLFGFAPGLVIALLSAVFGSVVSKALCRFFCLRISTTLREEYVQLDRLLRAIKGREGFKLVAMIRLTFVPYGLQNAFFAESEIDWPTYTLATTIGLFPLTLLNIVVGSTIQDLSEIIYHGKQSPYAVAQVIVAGIITVTMSYLTKREVQKVMGSAPTVPSAELELPLWRSRSHPHPSGREQGRQDAHARGSLRKKRPGQSIHGSSLLPPATTESRL